jgi:hypothetical protein
VDVDVSRQSKHQEEVRAEAAVTSKRQGNTELGSEGDLVGAGQAVMHGTGKGEVDGRKGRKRKEGRCGRGGSEV